MWLVFLQVSDKKKKKKRKEKEKNKQQHPKSISDNNLEKQFNNLVEKKSKKSPNRDFELIRDGRYI